MAATTPTATRCGCSDPGDCVDRRAGRYLTAIYWLGGEGRERVRTTEVSDRLAVAPASVTEMFESLAADALVDYEKRAGVTLTERGAAVASELAYRQCVVRTFFAAELDYEFDADAGYRFGYTVPGDGVEALRALAGHGDGRCVRDADGTVDCRCEASAE